ncbi:MAG TPA: GNAT family N-acetyltransferase [Burkholderiales bacterium]|nr:GNAT family N-acetyltransferase [Burkholderiales bacterium]
MRELTRLDGTAYEQHLLALGADDRRLRFGTPVADSVIQRYAAGIDFDRDALFGIFDDDLQLVGAAHLARGDDHAELGVSVLQDYRQRGFGGALLERAALHARNWRRPRLFMHCLKENETMMHLARKQGMDIVTDGGEADASLKLPQPDAGSYFGEVFAQRVALFDFALKALRPRFQL